jgi:transcription-repair coupling factor (superfamily II helicase)
VIAPARGLEAPLPVPADFRRQVLTLGAGDRVDREALVEHLESAGYERVESVTASASGRCAAGSSTSSRRPARCPSASS